MFRLKLTPSWQLTIPLSGALLGFIVGQLTGDFFIRASIVLIFSFLVAKLFTTKQLGSLLIVLLVSFGLFWLSIFRFDTVGPRYDSVYHLPQQEITVQGTIADYRGREDRTQLVLSHVMYGEDSRSDRLFLTINRPLADWQVGDRLSTTCKASIPQLGSYWNWLRAQGVYMTCSTYQDPIHLGRFITPTAVAWQLRANFESLVRSRFSEPYATLLTGLYIGDVFFSEQYQDIFKVTGISHIVAASGSNVTLTVVLMVGLLASFGIKRQDSLPWISLAILGFVVISGMSAPVVRAGIMGFLVLLGVTRGRKISMRNALLLAVVGMLFVKPLWLFHDIGFQLSVVSTWGLLVMTDFFKRTFSFVPEALGLQEAVSTTLAATLATAPIIILSFGQLSLISPVANLLVLPVLPYTLLTGAFTIALPELPALTSLPWLGLEWILRVSEALGALTVGFASFDTMIVRIIVSFVFVCAMGLILRSELRRPSLSL